MSTSLSTQYGIANDPTKRDTWAAEIEGLLQPVGITLPELNESHAPNELNKPNEPNEHSFAITAAEYITTAVQTVATDHTAGILASAPYTYVKTAAGHFKIATLSANSLTAGNAARDLALKRNSSAQQLYTSGEIFTGAVEEKVAVIITVQPSYNSAQLNDNESRPKKTKLTCDNSKKVGHTASKHFTKPNASKKAEKTYEGTLKKHSTLKPLGKEPAINANATAIIIHSETATATEDGGNFPESYIIEW